MKTTRNALRLGSRTATPVHHWELLEPMEARTLLTATLSFAAAAGTPPALLGGSNTTLPPTTIVTPIGLTIAATVGVPFTGDVGLIKGLTGVQLTQLKAFINWGDTPTAVTPGSTATSGASITSGTPGTVYFDTAGVLHVAGTHTYMNTGRFPVTVTVIQNPPAGSLQPSRLYRIYSSAVVTSQTTGVVITPTVNQSFTGIVGNFKYVLPPVANPVGTTLVAFINWGDGNAISKGTITLNTDGSYSVIGTHTYTAVSTFHITITVFEQYPWPTPLPVGTTATNGPLPSTLVPPQRLIAVINSTAIVLPGTITPTV
ncbi:MAG: hypothetical protein WCI73_08930 [Phycisphaerae bacterium]